MQSRNISYIAKLDHLRFLAAFIVLMYHARIFYSAPNFVPIPILDQGYVGVSLFMVLSGMILTLITYDRDISVRGFYANRALRIYPLFIFVVTLGYFSTSDPRETTVGIDYLFSLVPISNLSRLKYGPFGGQLWSVMVEIQFYLIFPIFAFMLKIRGATFYIAVIFLMIVLRLMIFIINGKIYDMAYFSIFGSIDIFLIGCLAGVFYKKYEKIRMPRFAWLAIFLAINIIIAVLYRSGFSNASIFWVMWPDGQGLLWAALIICYLRTDLSIPLSGVWSYLGKISYSLYAWHILIWMVVVRLMPLPFLSPYVTGGLIVLPLTIALAALSYHVIEGPFLMLRSRYVARSVQSVS